MDPLKAAYIEWIDTIADPENGWKDTEMTGEFFDRQDNIVRQVGFIFHEDEDFIGLVSGYMPSDEEVPIYMMRIKIPKKWILKRKNIKIKGS
jgi:hypothetical protein